MGDMYKLSIFAVLVLSIALFAGCADKVRVSGTVTFEDGEPLNRGQVTFRTADGKTYSGYLDKNGKYSPGEIRDGQPIPTGTYTVWVAGTGYSDEKYVAHQTVDSKYTSAESSTLIFEAKRGGQKTFDFTVERYVDPRRKR
jgi:hypothetical protein